MDSQGPAQAASISLHAEDTFTAEFPGFAAGITAIQVGRSATPVHHLAGGRDLEPSLGSLVGFRLD